MGGFEEESETALIGYCPDCDHVVHCLKSQQSFYCRDCGRTNMVSGALNFLKFIYTCGLYKAENLNAYKATNLK